MSESEVVELLRVRVAEVGSLRAFAVRHRISPTYVSMTLNGKMRPGSKILHALSLRRVVDYQPEVDRRPPGRRKGKVV